MSFSTGLLKQKQEGTFPLKAKEINLPLWGAD